ncbi:MipA/OmpV family protein [Methylophaga sp.]|uniref:MipA/OmpV family protein n=1 Tax=Methylophaga sp. TaxID=2024840 RepID=UPI0025E83E30|nr:MipA/OmpV family protein [Methylophaga sp.]
MQTLFTGGAALRGMAATLMISSLASPLSAIAADQQPDIESPSSTWGLGFAVMSKQDPYTDIDRETELLPIVTYENKYIELLGPQLEFKLPSWEINDSNKFEFRVVGKYEFFGYEDNDADILEGMDDRDGGFWMGAKVEWENPVADISAEIITEVSGDSEGSSFNLGLERSWDLNERFTLTPRVVASWSDKDYVDYYYGVRQEEVNANRSFYKGDSTVNIEAGIRGDYMFNEKHFMFLDLSVTSLGSEIEDSPLVDSSTQSSVFLGYIYLFK